MEFIIAQGGIPLGFNIVEVGLHFLTLVVLVIAMRFLLYKPVKKFMDKRSAEYKKIDDEYKQMQKTSEEYKMSGDSILEKAKKEAYVIEHEARLTAQEHSETILDNAKNEASQIIEKALGDAEKEKAQLKDEISESISELAINIASMVLEREVKIEDNDKIIDSVLEDWKSK